MPIPVRRLTPEETKAAIENLQTLIEDINVRLTVVRFHMNAITRGILDLKPEDY